MSSKHPTTTRKPRPRVISLRRQAKLFTLLLVILFNLGTHPLALAQNEHDLPSLGDATSGLISLQEEKLLGSAWLRALRGQIQTFDDPLVEDYFSSLIYRLAANSEVTNKNLELIIIDSPELNAFAVPGGVVGINTGLFLHASTEQEFASVLAHELAHLSQRHFARRLEQQQQELPLRLAGILASIVIGATVGSDAGMAALATTQAASIQSQLSYSRQNEQEADRLGIQTLYLAGLDPRAMPTMFEEMQRSTRLYGGQPPEYLSTHPVTESRISDSRNRAEQYQNRRYADDIEYHLMRTRVVLYNKKREANAIDFFSNALSQGQTSNTVATRYGLALAYIQDKQGQKGAAILDELLKEYPGRITFMVSYAQALITENRDSEALAFLQNQLSLNPDNYPLLWTLGLEQIKTENYSGAIKALQKLSYRHPSNPSIWYKLSEAYGKIGEIVRVHQSLAEYYLLTGELDKAIIQLQQAQRKSVSEAQIAAIQKRMADIFQLKKIKF